MNYFGLIFSFMVPGVILGLIAAAGIGEAGARRRKQAPAATQARRVGASGIAGAKQERCAQARRLYVHDLAADKRERAA
ncbi:MAG: hypothetical protein GX580_16930 [Candidatus Hydrogenedens sp.]|nr:hypothetical protein [Candidatus Hydrogenedens sp.]